MTKKIFPPQRYSSIKVYDQCNGISEKVSIHTLSDRRDMRRIQSPFPPPVDTPNSRGIAWNPLQPMDPPSRSRCNAQCPILERPTSPQWAFMGLDTCASQL